MSYATTSPARRDCTSGVRDRLLGLRLRTLRRAAGLSVDGAARRGDVPPATLTRLEHGRIVLPDPDAVRRLVHGVYAPTENEAADLDCLLVQVPQGRAAVDPFDDRGPGRTERLADLLWEAHTVRELAPWVLPARVRTVEYAAALRTDQRMQGAPGATDDLAETRPLTPVQVVIAHRALHQTIGSAAVMRAQLAHLLALHQTGGPVTVRVTTASAGEAGGEQGPLRLLNFGPRGGLVVRVQDRSIVYAPGTAARFTALRALDASLGGAETNAAVRAAIAHHEGLEHAQQS